MLKVYEFELKALYEITRIIGSALELDRMLERILAILGSTMFMKRAAVALVDAAGERLCIRASHGLTEQEMRRGVYRLDEGVTGRVFRTARPFAVPDVTKEPLFLDRTGSRKFDKEKLSFFGVPIFLSGKCIGVLQADRLFDQDVSLDEDVRFLSIVAQCIAQVVSLNMQVQEREEGLRRENTSLRARLSDDYRRFFIVGKSQPMLRVQQLVEKVAPTSATVLLLGESGAGKTLAARLIHELSDRAHHPFVKVNCAAIPEEVLEAELFGQAEGPLSGIKGARPGRLEEAHKGALLLDEIGELSPGTQGKLLRFLQEKEFERVGGGVRRVDVRVIAATNTELEKAVERGEFREDLYYRLNVFPITIPPLRRRREDIPSLLNHFLERLSREYGRRLVLTPAALDALVKYDWPGNVREMENLMERLSILVESGSIDVGDIPASLFSSPAAHVHRGGAPMSLQEMEKNEVVTALERHRWVQSRAARELGLTLRQMGYRVKKFGLEQLVHQRRREYRRAG